MRTTSLYWDSFVRLGASAFSKIAYYLAEREYRTIETVCQIRFLE